MKLRTPLLFVFLISLLLVPAQALAADEPVTKTVCASPFGYANLDELKLDLVTSAKRDAVNEIFGELITASTTVEDFVVTSDQIRASSIGYVRIQGDPDFYNGSNLAGMYYNSCIYYQRRSPHVCPRADYQTPLCH
jgi:hypothetical protein